MTLTSEGGSMASWYLDAWWCRRVLCFGTDESQFRVCHIRQHSILIDIFGSVTLGQPWNGSRHTPLIGVYQLQLVKSVSLSETVLWCAPGFCSCSSPSLLKYLLLQLQWYSILILILASKCNKISCIKCLNLGWHIMSYSQNKSSSFCYGLFQTIMGSLSSSVTSTPEHWGVTWPGTVTYVWFISCFSSWET